MSRILLAGLVLFASLGHAAAQGPLELIPQDAAAAIAIRNLDDLMKKGDKFLTDTDIRVPLRPSELFKEANNFLGIKQGLNRKGSAAIIAMGPEDPKKRVDTEFLELLVPVVPFSDADAMADNFGFAKGALASKKIMSIPKGPPNGIDIFKFAARTENHLFLAPSQKTLQRYLRSKSVAETFTASQRKQFNESDILVHFGRYLWEKETNNLTERIADKMKAGGDPADQAFAKQFADSLAETQDAVVGFRLDEGIESHFLANFPKDGKAVKFLKAMRDNRQPSTLKGLPEGNVLIAHASSGDSDKKAMLAKVLLHFMLQDILSQQVIVQQIDRLNYLGLFHEVWRQLQGNRLAVYQNADEKKLGLFSAVAILDTADAKEFLRDMKTLTKMAVVADSLDWSKQEVKDEIDIARLVRDLASSVYTVRQSATTRLTLIGEPALPYLEKALAMKGSQLETLRRARDLRDRISAVAAERRKELLREKDLPLFPRPRLTFVSNVEKRQGLTVDVIDIKIAGLEKVGTHQYTQLLGPDWDKVRLAVVGKQVVVLLGSDVALFDAALRNLQQGDTGLAGTKRLAKFHKQNPVDRLFEFHVSVEGIMRLITAKANRDTPLHLTSVSLSLGERSLQVDTRIPTSEMRAIAKKVQEEIR